MMKEKISLMPKKELPCSTNNKKIDGNRITRINTTKEKLVVEGGMK